MVSYLVKMNNTEMTFSWYDYTFFSLMLGVSAGMGIYFGCFGTKQATANEYLMGNKKMKMIPVAISLTASHVSGVTLLAIPADVYRFGACFWLTCLMTVFVSLIINYVYLPVFYNLQITSVYEYLEKRFDAPTRKFASFLFTLGVILYMPLIIYIPALAFSAATGTNVYYVAPILGSICIFYTTLGGLKAVVWTDTVQFVVTIGALFSVCVIGVQEAGGLERVWQISKEGKRLDIFDFDLDPTKRDSFWTCTIGLGMFLTLSHSAVNPTYVQKFQSVETLRGAKQTVIFFSIGIVTVISSVCFIGLIIYAKYATCDPYTIGAIVRHDQLVPHFIMDVASHVPGLPGLFTAGIFCSALSSLSACLNCLAGTFYEDFISKLVGFKLNEAHIGCWLKILVLVIGIISIALVYVIEHLGSILPLAISLGSVTNGPLLGMFTLGILFPKASKRGTLYGSVFGWIFSSGIVAAAQYYSSKGLIVYPTKPTSIKGCFRNMTFILHDKTNSLLNQPFFLFRISFYYYSAIGCIVTIMVGLLLSYTFMKQKSSVESNLLSPIVACFLKNGNIKREGTNLLK